MARALSEDEQKARVKYKGMTRREYNAKHSKFANTRGKSENGSFEIVALFSGNPIPQTAPFPNEAAALARFDVLRTSPACQSVKVVKNEVVYGANGKPSGLRPVTLYALVKTGQQFANSRTKLEGAKFVITGGTPWWATKA